MLTVTHCDTLTVPHIYKLPPTDLQGPIHTVTHQVSHFTSDIQSHSIQTLWHTQTVPYSGKLSHRSTIKGTHSHSDTPSVTLPSDIQSHSNSHSDTLLVSHCHLDLLSQGHSTHRHSLLSVTLSQRPTVPGTQSLSLKPKLNHAKNYQWL